MRREVRRSATLAIAVLCAAALGGTAGCGSAYYGYYGLYDSPLFIEFTSNSQFDTGMFNNTNDTTLPGTVQLNPVSTDLVLGGFAFSGTWSAIADSGAEGTLWNQIFWNTEPEGSIPPGTSLTVAVRAADDLITLSLQPFLTYASGSSLGGLVGRFIEVQATFLGSLPSKPVDGSTFGFSGSTPVLSDITITTLAPLEADFIEQIPFGGPFFGYPAGGEE